MPEYQPSSCFINQEEGVTNNINGYATSLEGKLLNAFQQLGIRFNGKGDGQNGKLNYQQTVIQIEGDQ